MKKLFLCISCLCMVFLTTAFDVAFAEIPSYRLTLGGGWVSGTFQKDSDIYKCDYTFTIKKPSLLLVDLRCYCREGVICGLFSQSGSGVKPDLARTHYGTMKKPVTGVGYAYLDPGKYKLVLSKNCIGNCFYDIRSTRLPVYTTVSKMHDTFARATSISFNRKVCSMLMDGHKAHYYKFTLKSTRDVIITTDCRAGYGGEYAVDAIILYNKLKKKIAESDDSDLDSYVTSRRTIKKRLKKGTYYIRVRGRSSGGLYHLRVR